MLVEAMSAIPWTKPEIVARDASTLPKLAPFYNDGFNALMADGYPRFFRASLQGRK